MSSQDTRGLRQGYRILKLYVVTRDLRVQDFQDCLEWLRARGQHANSLNAFKGGINYSHKPDEFKNVRFNNLSGLPPPNEAGNFSGDLTHTLMQVQQPEWHKNNKLSVLIEGKFTQTELSYLHICMLSVLQCKSNVIANEERAISPLDTPEDINNYLNIDYPAALEKYTKPNNAYYSTLLHERRFTCWHCRKQTTYDEYARTLDHRFEKKDAFYAVLVEFVHGTQRWCDECDTRHAYPNGTN